MSRSAAGVAASPQVATGPGARARLGRLVAPLTGVVLALLAIDPATTRAAEGGCDYRAFGTSWGDDVIACVCLNEDGHGPDGTRAHAYARIEARGTRNPVRSCEARVSVTLSTGARPTGQFRDGTTW